LNGIFVYWANLIYALSELPLVSPSIVPTPASIPPVIGMSVPSGVCAPVVASFPNNDTALIPLLPVLRGDSLPRLRLPPDDDDDPPFFATAVRVDLLADARPREEDPDLLAEEPPLRAALLPPFFGAAFLGAALLEAPPFFAAAFLGADFFAAPPFLAAAFFGATFLAAVFWGAAFLAAPFLAAAFFGAAFLAAPPFLAAAFLGAAFFGAAFLAAAFLGAAFLEAPPFFAAAFLGADFLAAAFLVDFAILMGFK
jgi:hypothetical protein